MNTFFKHTFVYFLSKGIPGILSFIAILFYSKILTPAEYGIYSLIISIVGIINIIFFDWFRFGMSRFLPEYIAEDKRDEFLLFVKNKIQLAILISIIVTIIAYLIYPYVRYLDINKTIILYIGILVILQYVFTLLTQIFITELKPNDYMKSNFIKSFFATVIGIVLVYLGFGYMGLIIAMIFSFIFSVLYSIYKINFPRVNFNFKLDRELLKKITIYSLPLSASAGLSYILSYSNRFIISHYRSVEETGLFSLGYDFSQQTIGVFISIAATSAFPIAMKLYTEQGNSGELKKHMNKSLQMIFFIALPIVVVFCATSHDLTHLLLGKKFSKLDFFFLPLISMHAFVLGVKSFYFDLFFYLKKETKFQLLILVFVAILNVGLNIIFVPKFGYISAVWCALVCSALAVLTTYFVTRKILVIPIDFIPILKVVLSALLMFFSMRFFGDSKDIYFLVLKLILGGVVFISSIIIFNRKTAIELLSSSFKKK